MNEKLETKNHKIFKSFMKKLFSLTFLCLLNFSLYSQDNLNQDLKQAKKHYQKGNYGSSMQTLRQLRLVAKKTDTAFYTEVVNGLCFSLYFNLHKMVLVETNWDSVIKLSNEYLNVVKVDSIFANPELQSKKYWIYKDLLVAHHGLGNHKDAEEYRKILYSSKNQGLLPDGLNEYFNFEKFVFNDLNVWAYEWFTELGDKETEGSFSKHVYYIYSKDSKGKDKEQLFTLETVKVHKLQAEQADFVLTKRIYKKDSEKSETMWTYQFKNPVDFTELHNAILEYLKGNTEPDAKMKIKR